MVRRDRDEAFDEFARSRSQALHRTAYLLVGRRGLAEDLVQETLAKVYAAWPRLREPAALEAYVRRTMTTTAISWTRRRSRREQPSDRLPEIAADAAEQVGDADEMWEAVLGLPPRQRATLVLRYYEGLSVKATAHMLGCTTGTVKSQTSVALTALRGVVGDPRAVDEQISPRPRPAQDLRGNR